MCIYTPITRHLFADGVRRLLIIALFMTTLLFISLCNEMCVWKWNCRVMKGLDHQFVSLVLMIPTSGHAVSPHSIRRVQYFHPLLRVVSCLLKERMLRNVYFFSAPRPPAPQPVAFCVWSAGLIPTGPGYVKAGSRLVSWNGR